MSCIHFCVCMCFLLGIGSELCKCDLPFGLGVNVGTGVVVLDPTGVYGTVSPTIGMGLNLVRLNSMSVRLSMFLSLE